MGVVLRLTKLPSVVMGVVLRLTKLPSAVTGVVLLTVRGSDLSVAKVVVSMVV